MKTLISFGTLIALLSLPLAGQVVGPEIPLSPPRPAPAGRVQKNPAVATDGDVFLVAWTNHDRGRSELYAARVTRSGQLLDEISFPIAIKPESVWQPRVAWTGRVFIVLYGSVGKRISRVGKVLGELQLPPGGLMSLTCNASRCLAIYQRYDLEARTLRGTRLNSDGEVMVADIEIASYLGIAAFVPSASNGANFLVAWHLFDSGSTTERQALYARAVTSSGGLGTSRRIAASQLALGYHDVESDGSGYLLAWKAGELSSRVEARRFNSGGNPSGDEYGGANRVFVRFVAFPERRTRAIRR